MKFDFHCHTNCSDGTLSPEQLMALAFERNIDVLAITDHDSIAAYKQFLPGTHLAGQSADQPENQTPEKSLKLISGCEFSALWEGRVIHIVGLNFEFESPVIQKMLARASQLREERAKRIDEVLEKLGIEGTLEGAKRHAAGGIVARPHFARYLVESGVVPSEKKAFKKYLGKGKPGDIKVAWPQVSEVAEAISAAGGVSVIAHPVKYDFTRTKLLRLIDEFKSSGGDAVEVISGNQPSNQTQQLVDITNQRNMFASAGSDFHQPGQPWADLGKAPILPISAKPVWTEFKSLS